MKTLRILMIAFLSVIIVFTGCKKDDDADPAAPEYQVKSVTIPADMQNSNNIGAQQATAYVNMANSFANVGAMMVPPAKSTLVENLKDGTPWTYTWDIVDGDDNFSVTLTVTEDAIKYMWEFTITGIINGINVNNFVYLRGIEYKDGSYNSLEAWNPETGDLEFIWTWTDTGGIFTMVLEFPGDFKIIAIVNPDGSGSLEYYDWANNQWVMSFRVIWTAAGTGEYWVYEDGIVVENDTWP